MINILKEIERISETSDKEVCGIVIEEDGRAKAIQLKNVSNNEEFCFIADQRQFFDAIKKTSFYDKSQRSNIVCFFHSHIHKNEIPSSTDMKYRLKNILHIIYSLATRKFFLLYPEGGRNAE